MDKKHLGVLVALFGEKAKKNAVCTVNESKLLESDKNSWAETVRILVGDNYIRPMSKRKNIVGEKYKLTSLGEKAIESSLNL